MFIIKKEENANKSILNLFDSLISGTERLSINNKKYAAPATHAPTISIGELTPPIKIMFPVNDTESYNKLKIK